MKALKTILGVVIIFLMAAASVFGADATEIAKQSHLAYYYAADDGLAKVTMKIVSKSGKERVREFTMLRKDIEDGGNQKYYTYFFKPSDVSRMTFMVWKDPMGDDKRWLYLPAIDLVRQISAADKTGSFVNSDFTYEDVSGRHWTEDDHTLVAESEQLDGKDTYVIKSVPKKNYGGFAEKKSWIDKETYLPLKEEYYDSKGELEKVFSADKVEVIDEVPTITVRTIKIVSKEKYTTIQFDEIKYNVGMGEDVFTERYLKNPPRKFVK